MMIFSKAEALRFVAKELLDAGIKDRAAELLAESEALMVANGKWPGTPEMEQRWEKLRLVELKPCPFCGFQIEIDDADCIYPATRDRTVWSINCYCTGGGCDAEILGGSPEEVVDKWNRRI